MKRWLRTATIALLATLGCALLPETEARAQAPAAQPAVEVHRYRSTKSLVRGGLMQRRDSLRTRTDSLAKVQMLTDLDSMFVADFAADSAALAALRTDIASLGRPLPGAAKGLRRRGGFMSDSMSLSKVCWISAALPGYGQVYNKQYWKLPVLYGTLGTGLALFIHENNRYRPLKREYEALTDISNVRSPKLDALQTEMIRSNTRRQVYLGVTIASYIYFLGDAAVNYSTNDVSNVKKATTLACIFPGAGQIYNKSYWKVPFVVGGFASMIYCIDWNNRGYQRFKKAYNLRASWDKANEAYQKDPEHNPQPPAHSTDEFGGRYQASFLRNLRNNYRRNRDLCIIITGALYVLQIVDAHVDAHLKDYDISDDLSMNLEPMVDYAYVPAAGGNRPVFGFNLGIKF